MVAVARTLAVTGMLSLAPVVAQAQHIPVPSFLDRGIDDIFKGPDGQATYASPGANELLPNAADVGALRRRALRRFEPIALPPQTGRAIIPDLALPSLPAYAPQIELNLDQFANTSPLVLTARLTEDGEVVPNGLSWRLFAPMPTMDGRPQLIASSDEASAHFNVPAGSYILHTAFGGASVIERITVDRERPDQTVVLDAGGLKLDASVGETGSIDRTQLRFDIYTAAEMESDRQLIMSDVEPGEVVRLNAGTYHVISRYGQTNAKSRADIRVSAGKTTEATMRHRAALVTLKLVRSAGGEALADTAWRITTTSGDLVRESVGAFPSMVLAAGDYVVSAKNREQLYERQYTVESGDNADVEVLTTDRVRRHAADMP